MIDTISHECWVVWFGQFVMGEYRRIGPKMLIENPRLVKRSSQCAWAGRARMTVNPVLVDHTGHGKIMELLPPPIDDLRIRDQLTA